MNTSPPLSQGARIDTRYRTYKAATRSLALWLANTAKSLGAAINVGGNKKGNQNGLQGIKVEQFRTFTNLIVDADSRVDVPSYIVDVASKAFSLRKEWGSLLRGSDLECDQRHEHFNSVIGDVLAKLKAHFQVSSKEANDAKTTSSKKEEAKKEEELVASFNLLDVEPLPDASESEEGGDSDEEKTKDQLSPKSRRAQKPTNKKTNKKKKNGKKVKKGGKAALPDSGDSHSDYYLDEEEDPYFVIFCLLSDLSSVRKYVREAWTDYTFHRLDLTTVSLITNATFDIIRTYQQDFPAISNLLRDYSRTIRLFLSRDLGEEDPGYKLFFKLGNSEAQVKVIGKSLNKIPKVADLIFANAFYFLNGPRHQVVWKGKNGKMATNTDRDFFGDKSCDADEVDVRKANYTEKLLLDIRILAAFARDVYNVKTFKHIVRDHFTMQWEEFARTGDKTITLTQAFGAQIYLDIIHVFGIKNLNMSFCDIDTSSTIMRLFQTMQEMSRLLPEEFYKPSRKHNEVKIPCLELFEMLRDITLEDFGDVKKKGEEKTQLVRKEEYPFTVRNPLYCGLLQFQIINLGRESGILQSSFWKTILTAGQLYYSCRMHRDAWKGKNGFNESNRALEEGCNPTWNKKKLQWDDMDFLFEMLGKESFFGGILPIDDSDLVRQSGGLEFYLQTIGRRSRDLDNREIPSLAPPDVNEVRTDRRENGHHLINFQSFAVSHQLWYRKYKLIRGRTDSINSWTMESLIELVGGTLQENESSNLANAKTGEGPHRVSQVALLEAIKKSLQKERKALRFDMISFHVICFQMLRHIHRYMDDRIEFLSPEDKESFKYQEDDFEGLTVMAPAIFMTCSKKNPNPVSVDSEEYGKTKRIFTSRPQVAIDEAIRGFLKRNQCKSVEVSKIESSWGINEAREGMSDDDLDITDEIRDWSDYRW